MLIVIEGVDGSGKATQSKLLCEYLNSTGREVKKLEFPNYASNSSALVKMYLQGDFGKNANDVNAYAASTFYAVDRYASYKMDWESEYKKSKIIVADRYVSSNMIHQGVKITNIDEREKYLNWVSEFEYSYMGIPKPDLVIFLCMDPKISQELMKDRENKAHGGMQKDIHEQDKKYLSDTYQTAVEIAKKQGWKTVLCQNENGIRTIEDIHNEIVQIVKEVI